MKKKKPTLFSVLMIHCGLFIGLTLSLWLLTL